VKLVLIVLVARYFTNLATREPTWKDIFKAIAFVAVPMVLVLKQPDLGTADLFTGAPAGIVPRGIDWRKGGILVLVMLLAWSGLEERQGAKALPKAAPDQLYEPGCGSACTGYQILQSKIAVGDGGVFGRGANQGTQTQGDFCPSPTPISSSPRSVRSTASWARFSCS